MKINDLVINQAVEDIKELLNAYQVDLDTAFIEAGDDEPLKVSLNVKVSPEKGALKVDTGISFTTGKVKDSKTSYVDEKQEKLAFGS